MNWMNKLLIREEWLTEDERGRVTASLKFARTPLYDPILYLCVLLTGLQGSLFGEQIIRGLGHFAWFGCPTFNPRATWFLASAVITSFLYGAQRWSLLLEREAQNRTYANSQKRIEDSTERLETSTDKLRLEIRTMPPENFLDAVGRTFRSAENTAHSLLIGEKPPPKLVRQGIRLLLDNFAELALLFDNNPEEPYHANVMTYHPSTELKDATVSALESRLKFEREGVHIKKMDGVLDLRLDLSTCSDGSSGGGPVKDDTLEPLVIAIPSRIKEVKEDPDEERYYALPGAPIAWADRYADQYSNTDELLSWYESDCVPDEHVKNSIQDYFNQSNNLIGSFVAVALIYNQEGEKETEQGNIDNLYRKDEIEVPIGILNIHRRSEGILKDYPHAGDYFLGVTRPLRILLTRLLYLLREVEENKYGNWINLTSDWKHQVGWPPESTDTRKAPDS
jgi:hypothetical protein